MYLDAIAQMKDGQMVLGDCASGGRRLDIEMLRRMTVNSRSDNCMDPLSSQGYTYALSLWMPRHGQSATGNASVLEPTLFDTDNDCKIVMLSRFAAALSFFANPKGITIADSFKSFMGTSMGFDYDWYYAPADAAWWTRVGGWLERYDRIRWAFSATEAVDFFPLTEHSVDDRSWIAWQWRQVHDGKERGVVQVFRQFACPVSHATLPIYALDPAKHYCKQQPANPDSFALPENAGVFCRPEQLGRQHRRGQTGVRRDAAGRGAARGDDARHAFHGQCERRGD